MLDGKSRGVISDDFRGDWAKPFGREATRLAPFHTSPSAKSDVPTMHQTETFGWMQGDRFQALALGYARGGFSMLVLLPDAVDGLAALEDGLTADALDRIVATLVPTRVAVALPKFEVNPARAASLSPLLQDLGLSAAFDRDRARPANAGGRGDHQSRAADALHGQHRPGRLSGSKRTPGSDPFQDRPADRLQRHGAGAGLPLAFGGDRCSALGVRAGDLPPWLAFPEPPDLDAQGDLDDLSES